MDPLVSVIMPSYNHRQYVVDAIQSVLAQTYRNIELVVVDDGSQDGSSDLLKELSREHGFSLHLGRNGGLCRTLNKGVQHSHGKYIAPIASDDVWVHDKLERQVRLLESNDAIAACSGGHLKISPTGEPLPFYKQRFYRAAELSFEDVFLWRGTLSGPLAMVRRSVFDQTAGYDESCTVEDWDLWLRIANLGYKLYRMPHILGFYRIHSANTYSNIAVTEPSLLRSASKFSQHPNYQQAIKAIYLRSFGILSSTDRRKALPYLGKAFHPNLAYLKALVKLAIPYDSK